jgi:hypothetical protein
MLANSPSHVIILPYKVIHVTTKNKAVHSSKIGEPFSKDHLHATNALSP